MEISEIKQHLSIYTILSHYGHKPDKNNMLRCPFHDDKKASMKIYPKTNTAFCFAAGCKTNGKSIDTIDYIMHMDNITKHEAIVKAKEMAGLNGKSTPVPVPPKEIIMDDKIGYDPNFDRRDILEKIYQVFKNGLNSATTKKAKEYLKSRNIDFTKIDCGYNSGQFHHQNRLSEEDKTSCIKASLLLPYMGKVPHAKGQTYTAFAKDCIIFPLLDRKGRIVGLYGRNIYKPSDSKEDGKHYYLKDRKGLYPHYPNPQTRKLIITESIINAATLLQIEEITEEYEVLCCFSTTGLKGEVLQAIKELEYLEELIFAFDGDKAGKDATKKYSKELSELMPQVKFSSLNIPDNEDINSLSIGHEPEIFTHLINSRTELFSLNGTLTEKSEIKAFENEPNIKDEPAEEPREQKEVTPMQTSYLNTKNPEYITFESRNLLFHLMGGINIQQLDRLKVTLKINRTDSNDPLHIIRHTFDMYHTDLLEKFINKAADKLEVSTTDLTKDFALLINMLEHYKLKELDKIKQNKPKKKKLTEPEVRESLDYLSAPDLTQRTATDLKDMGIVGEEINSQIYWYAMTSRKCENQVSVICIGSSAMGKSYLQEKVAEGIPEEEKIENTQFSDNCFYYFKRDEIKYMLFLIEDLDGAQGVMFPIREMQTKGKLSKTVTLKDSKGMPRTFTIIVEGPVIFCACTTREKVYEDNANRSLLLYLDTSKEQDKRINDYTKQKRAGLVDKHKEEQIKLKLQNVQRVLKPIEVLNPYAVYIDLPDKVFKPRRTITLLLNFIEAIAFYHQHQPNVIKTATGIEVHPDHIEYAFKLLRDVLFRKSDELSGNCRDFFEDLKGLLKQENKQHFYAAEIREKFRIPPRSVRRYLKDLKEYGFLKVIGGDKYKKGHQYEVVSFDDATEIKAEIDRHFEAIMQKIRQEHEKRIKK